MDPKFKVLKTSMEQYEVGGIRHALIYSQHVPNQRCDLSLYMPPQTDQLQGVPLVVCLHGVEGSHWDWISRGGLRARAQQLIDTGEIQPMVFAMPSDGHYRYGSAYLPLPSGDYGRWIAEDCIAAARESCSAVNDSSPVYLFGQSMGGYGTLMIGGKYPKNFNGFWASARSHRGMTCSAS